MKCKGLRTPCKTFFRILFQAYFYKSIILICREKEARICGCAPTFNSFNFACNSLILSLVGNPGHEGREAGSTGQGGRHGARTLGYRG